MNLIASKLLGLRGRFGIELTSTSNQEDGMNAEKDGGEEIDNWSFEWWKVFMMLGPLHPKASWAVTRGQITKTAPLIRSYHNVRACCLGGRELYAKRVEIFAWFDLLSFPFASVPSFLQQDTPTRNDGNKAHAVTNAFGGQLHGKTNAPLLLRALET